MNRADTAELIKVMRHYADGGEVERLVRHNNYWAPDENPTWLKIPSAYRIALSPEDRLIMDAWEADNDCLEVYQSGTGWSNKWVDYIGQNGPPNFDTSFKFRIKSKYTPEQQLIVDAHERGESIDCVLLNTQMERAWGRISVRAVLNFRDFAYRLTPVVIVTYKSTGHGAEVKGKIREAEKGSEYDKAIICAPHLWKWEGERTL